MPTKTLIELSRKSPDTDPALLFVTDQSGRITKVAESFVKLSGKPVRSLVGMPLSSLVSANTAKKLQSLFSDSGQNIQALRIAIIGKNKRRIYCSPRAILLPFNKIEFEWNASQSKKVDTIAPSFAAYANAGQPVIIFSLQTKKILFANVAAQNLYGYSRSAFDNLFLKNLVEGVHVNNDGLNPSTGFREELHCDFERKRFPVKVFSSVIEIDGITYGIMYVEKSEIRGIHVISSDSSSLFRSYSITDIWGRMRFQADVLENISDAVISTDLSFYVNGWNKAAEKLWGIPAEIILGKPLRLYTNHQFVSCSKEEVKKQLHERGEWEGKAFIEREDGSLVYFLLSISSIRDHNETKIGYAGIYKEFTKSHEAEEALRISEQQLREYSERMTNILNSITDGFIAVDKELNVLLWNRILEDLTGVASANVIGKRLSEAFPGLLNSTSNSQFTEAMEKYQTFIFEHRMPVSRRWFEICVYPWAQGLFIYFRDVTERKKQENILSLEKEVLEINARAEGSLKLTLDYFLEKLEKIFPGMTCAVHALSGKNGKLETLSACGLSNSLIQSMDALEDNADGSVLRKLLQCKEAVVINNIQQHPIWRRNKEIAALHGLRSCWSFPIMNSAKEVMAILVAYHKTPFTPVNEEFGILEKKAHLLGIIFENKMIESRIRDSNERYLLATKATNDALWDWDMQNDVLFWGEGFSNIFGYHFEHSCSSFDFWRKCVHPDDLSLVNESLDKFVDERSSGIWEHEYRFRNSEGKYKLIYDRGFLLFDSNGNITRMIGSMQDITEKKEMERKLHKQELNKQKMIAQAVVDAQEKERAEIGTELHDNVNQILSTARLYLELAKNDEAQRIELITRSTQTIANAINEIRSISHSLVPSSIADLGLISSVEDLVENIRFTRKLNVEFYFDAEIDNAINRQQKLMLFRIIQEQVNNILRHAEASNLIIELLIEECHIALTITDNGKGFDKNNIKNKKGVGLSNINSRVELFNGTVTMQAAPGKGCKLNIQVPISNP